MLGKLIEGYCYSNAGQCGWNGSVGYDVADARQSSHAITRPVAAKSYVICSR
jgi:hypothetical protein